MHQAEQLIAYVAPVIRFGQFERLNEILVPGHPPQVGVVQRPTFRPGLVRPDEIAG